MERDAVASIIEGEILASEVVASAAAFDLNLPLTDEEQGILADQFDVSRTPTARAPRELEDELYTYREPAAPEGVATDPAQYGAEYRTYLRWQSVAAIAANDDVWLAFQELVLIPFVKRCKAEDDEYTGFDRDQAFALRLRRRAVEEFSRYILATVTSAGEVPRPVLIGEKK